MKEQDYASIRKMIECKVLHPVSSSLLPKGGHLKVHCPDGDTTPFEVADFHTICKRANNSVVCTHLISVAGGPGGIPRRSPMHPLFYKDKQLGTVDQFVFSFIEGALHIKQGRVPNIALIPHCPCGMANLKNISVLENFSLTFEAKDIIRSEFPNTFNSIRVMPHINFEGYPEAIEGSNPFKLFVLRRAPFLEFMRNVNS